MKKVVILGAGIGQIPLINYCKKRGCFVIVISIPGNYPGFKLSDKNYHVDVTDKDAVLEIAKNEKIDAIFTDQLDAGVLTAAYVCEKLGLSGIGYDVALKFTNKYIMLSEAEKIGIPVPRYVSVDAVEMGCKVAEEIGYPVVIKPADGSSSEGVFKINNETELREHFNEAISASIIHKILIEQYIPGNEWVVETFTNEYHVSPLIIGHRDYFSVPNTFVPCATVFRDIGTATTYLEQRILELNEKIIHHFGLKFGITHGEYMYNPDEDTIYLMEIAARGGGVFISSDLIPLSCGIDANQLLIEYVLSQETLIDVPPPKKGAAAYFCYRLPEGTVKSIDIDNSLNTINGVHKAYFNNIDVGMTIPPFRDKYSRKGPILVSGNTKDDCYKIIAQIKDKIIIKMEGRAEDNCVIWN